MIERSEGEDGPEVVEEFNAYVDSQLLQPAFIKPKSKNRGLSKQATRTKKRRFPKLAEGFVIENVGDPLSSIDSNNNV